MEVKHPMIKRKVLIKGKYITPNTIEIKADATQQLIPGQKVLIYRPTDKSIVGAKGKIIGKKERVLGSGNIEYQGGKLLVRVPQKSTYILRKTYGRNLGSSKRALVFKYKRPVQTEKRINEVYIKPIEE